MLGLVEQVEIGAVLGKAGVSNSGTRVPRTIVSLLDGTQREPLRDTEPRDDTLDPQVTAGRCTHRTSQGTSLGVRRTVDLLDQLRLRGGAGVHVWPVLSRKSLFGSLVLRPKGGVAA